MSCSTSWSAVLSQPMATTIVKTMNATASAAIVKSRGISCLNALNGSALAAATEHGGAAGDAHARERPPTREARLPPSAVDLQDLLLAADLTPRVAIGVHRAPA